MSDEPWFSGCRDRSFPVMLRWRSCFSMRSTMGLISCAVQQVAVFFIALISTASSRSGSPLLLMNGWTQLSISHFDCSQLCFYYLVSQVAVALTIKEEYRDRDRDVTGFAQSQRSSIPDPRSQIPDPRCVVRLRPTPPRSTVQVLSKNSCFSEHIACQTLAKFSGRFSFLLFCYVSGAILRKWTLFRNIISFRNTIITSINKQLLSTLSKRLKSF